MKKKFLFSVMALLIALTQSITSFAQSNLKESKFKIDPLPYGYDALEPYIDKETMILHHDKHYQAYVDKLNNAISNHPELYFSNLEEILTNLESLPEDVSLTIKNNAGGAYNHSFFFNIMTDKSTKASGKLLESIERDFGSFDNFKNAFSKAALDVFGSGWVWLVSNSDGKLAIITTANQDSPITLNLKPIIGLDVWEHAYYLKYKNQRSSYIDNWFNVINWDKALEYYISSKDK